MGEPESGVNADSRGASLCCLSGMAQADDWADGPLSIFVFVLLLKWECHGSETIANGRIMHVVGRSPDRLLSGWGSLGILVSSTVCEGCGRGALA
ncbi:hypothetical protein FHW16_003499 [Phyllobacterium myrsinacearum]|uniref:Uncharacterized protein n=1 Tax=Phyllobacterium myrsinacearum TaxID=28101 RepID=A0A839ET56_9HYPH|nr:hypothetical protein [Phyllobacterium myrsinacearum]